MEFTGKQIKDIITQLKEKGVKFPKGTIKPCEDKLKEKTLKKLEPGQKTFEYTVKKSVSGHDEDITLTIDVAPSQFVEEKKSSDSKKSSKPVKVEESDEEDDDSESEDDMDDDDYAKWEASLCKNCKTCATCSKRRMMCSRCEGCRAKGCGDYD
jgi:enolase